MKNPTKDEVNKVVKKYISLRNKTNKNKSDLKQLELQVVNILEHLVKIRCNRYRNFSNYNDLLQEGFEAVFMALKTYNPAKGDFIWWMNKYMNTKISRAANSYSTIKIPMHMIKEFTPHKVKKIPLLIEQENPQSNSENNELKKNVRAAIDLLPEKQKEVVMSVYEFSNRAAGSVSQASRELNMSRAACVKILSEAKKNIKNNLENMVGENNE